MGYGIIRSATHFTNVIPVSEGQSLGDYYAAHGIARFQTLPFRGFKMVQGCSVLPRNCLTYMYLGHTKHTCSHGRLHGGTITATQVYSGLRHLTS